MKTIEELKAKLAEAVAEESRLLAISNEVDKIHKGPIDRATKDWYEAHEKVKVLKAAVAILEGQ